MKRDTLAIAVWSALLAFALVLLTGIVALAVLAATWIFDRLPAAVAWLDADPLRLPALGIGALALVALAVAEWSR